MKKIFYFILAAVTVVLAACGDGNVPEFTPSDVPGSLPGAFAVAPGKFVLFSQGNLRYSGGTYSFNETQWSASTKSDFFKWNSTEFVEWGLNKIANGGNKGNLWRTLSDAEWRYLLCGRSNATERFGLGTVNDMHGLILLPNNWQLPEGLSFNPSVTIKDGLAWNGYLDRYEKQGINGFLHNIYDGEEWTAMEKAGAVFLPAAGECTPYADNSGTDLSDINREGSYWSCTKLNDKASYLLEFYKDMIVPSCWRYKDGYYSVRLVRDIK